MKRGIVNLKAEYKGKKIRLKGNELIISDEIGDYVFPVKRPAMITDENRLVRLAMKKMVL